MPASLRPSAVSPIMLFRLYCEMHGSLSRRERFRGMDESRFCSNRQHDTKLGCLDAESCCPGESAFPYLIAGRTLNPRPASNAGIAKQKRSVRENYWCD